MNEPWRVTLFGGLRAQRGEQVITRFKTQKVAALFAYLAFHLRQVHAREILIELLWPESDAPTLRNSLSVALSSLRNQFEPPGTAPGTVLRADRFSVGLNPVAVTTDVAAFEQALKAAASAGSSLERAQHLTSAVELYQGPLLPGYYEEWILPEQARLSGLFLDAANALVSYLEEIGDPRTALSHARHAVAIDPLREEGQRQLIRLLAADGQPGAALRQYKDYERLLEDEVGDEPPAGLRALSQRIEKESGLAAPAPPAPAVRRHVPPASTASAVPGGAPATVTFLMTDIEGSTHLSQQSPHAYAIARVRHHRLLRQEFARHGGHEVKETGDGFVAAFPTAGSAVACAVAAQKALAEERWPEGIEPLKVCMALHTGDVRQSGEDGQYHGIALHHASRMLTAARGGQILVSDATASLATGGGNMGVRLVDLGVYRLRDVPEAKRLFQAEYPHMRQTDFGPLGAEAGHRANVPPRFNRFFGREPEMILLREMLLSPEVRLVTVMGPGGNGKTRLSLEVAERLAEPFSGAVYFVALQDLTGPNLIAGTILDSLGVPRASHKEPLEQAIEALSDKPTLLVLDNLEHLLDGATGVVQALLSRVPTLKLLTTSRQLLGLSAERGFSLSPLPVPGTQENPEQLSLYDSVRLFIDRAQQVLPYFQVSHANAAAVAALVGGLEGIPLAIELAAARIQVLTPAQMLSQLSHRFDFLASRKRDVVERQRTLRGALEWSYRLLAPELQRFFSRLSVFRGGWSVEAAEQVCEEPLALDYLEQLRECSLVLSSETGAGAYRFLMLETLREYGQELLAERKEADAIRHRHLSCFLALAEEADERLQGPDQQARLEALEREHENLRAALAWSSSGADAVACLRLAGALGRFWDVRGYFREGREWCASALRGMGTRAQLCCSGARAKALFGAGSLANAQSDYGAARLLFEEGLTIYRELRDKAGVAATLMHLGSVARFEGDYAAAHSLVQEGLTIFRELGNRRGVAATLVQLGIVPYIQGDYAAARSLFEEGLTIFRELGDKGGIAYSLTNLGAVARFQGDYVAAGSFHDECLLIRRELEDKQGIASTLIHLGVVAYEQGDYGAARSLFEEGLTIFRELGDKEGIAYSLTNLGAVARFQGDTVEAGSLHHESLAMRRELGDKRGIAATLNNLGAVACGRGDYEAARSLFNEGLTNYHELGDKRGIAASLESLAGLAAAHRWGWERAACLDGAAAALREAIGMPLPPNERSNQEQRLAAMRATLGEEAFQAAFASGRNLSGEQAIAYALE